MRDAIQRYWNDRSPRERILLAVMLALLGLTILWFGIVGPLQSTLKDARLRHSEALDRNAAIHAKVDLLARVPPAGRTALSGPVDQFITQSAADAGFTLERIQAQGAGQVDIAIASARPGAFLAWVHALEGQGVRIESITAQPAATAGSISVQAVLKGDQ